MDFFEGQEAARRNTGRLVLLFALAVASIILSVYLVVSLAVLFIAEDGSPAAVVWNPGLFAVVVAATTTVIGGGSLHRIAQLRGGGRVVAEGLGGRIIASDTIDPAERRMLNVVEEMAIASGTAVPPVYLMPDEPGINAFAAGFTPDDAVIGVTAGALQQLNRAELQGVVAHEFSHILNGDMRLNIRLIGILHGILVIGLIGYFILRSLTGRPGRRSRRDKDDGGAILAIMAVGAGLAVVGFLGTWFGNLIKAGVSRQREYLADASAVQFTRDPGSIADALKRIGGFVRGSGLTSPNAPEASHMFFAKGLTSGFASMFATHPPLTDRIRRIEPGWDGQYLSARVAPAEAAVSDRVDAGMGPIIGALGGVLPSIAVGSAVAQVGRPTQAHVEHASALLARIPPAILEAAHEPFGARALVYAMLLDSSPEVRQRQLSQLARDADAETSALVGSLAHPVAALDPEARLPVIDLVTPALRRLAPAQFAAFKAEVEALQQAEPEVSLFERVLARIIVRHVEPQFGEAAQAPVLYYSLARLEDPCTVLLSALAHGGHSDAANAERAFAAGRARLGLASIRLCDRDQCGFDALDGALTVLAAVSFPLKRDLLEAGVATIAADRLVTRREGELLRGVADALGCPMPPLLPGQPLA